MKSIIYMLLRFWNDATAIRRGKVGRRVARRITGRMAGRWMRRLFG